MSETTIYFRYFAFTDPLPLWLGAEAVQVR
jgi:hypothetical protein